MHQASIQSRGLLLLPLDTHLPAGARSAPKQCSGGTGRYPCTKAPLSAAQNCLRWCLLMCMGPPANVVQSFFPSIGWTGLWFLDTFGTRKHPGRRTPVQAMHGKTQAGLHPKAVLFACHKISPMYMYPCHLTNPLKGYERNQRGVMSPALRICLAQALKLFC